jgi:hypothetical protein
MTKEDNPSLALAIVSFLKGKASCVSGKCREVSFYRFYSDTGVDFLVREDDWFKVAPYFRDGSFDTNLFPESRNSTLHPDYVASVSDFIGGELYTRVLTVLDRLFTT